MNNVYTFREFFHFPVQHTCISKVKMHADTINFLPWLNLNLYNISCIYKKIKDSISYLLIIKMYL